jgi:hypothetical protein
MTWFAFANDGDVYELNGEAEKSLVATFAHGYATMAQAIAHKNGPASPLQASLLASFVADASSPRGGGVSGVMQIATINASGVQKGNISLGNNPATNVAKTAIGDVIGQFNLNAWFLRGGEILLGLVLVAVGVARLTGTPNVISASLKTKLPIPIPV